MIKNLLKICLVPACLSVLCALNLSAQTVTVNTPQLAFDTTFENAPDSLPLIINNPLGYDVQVTGIRFYDTYNQPAFSASRQNFIVASQASETVWIRFAPLHNIFHNSELLIETNSHRGDVSVDLTGQGKYSLTYYNLSDNLAEEALKNMLHTMTGNGYDSLGYNMARDSMFMLIDNERVNGQGATQNTLECIYTGRQAVGYTSRTDCQSNYSFNTEHTWPQSLFSSLEPMKSDLHHLFPTDDNANNVRANYPFGVVTNPSWQLGGSKYANSVFEPRDAQKGATARALFYFALRYQNYGGFLTSQESILRTWHEAFPPVTTEINRNEKISTLQHNRNPFVDYPQLLDRITTISAFSSQAPVFSIDVSDTLIDYGYVTSSVHHVYHFVVVNNGNQNVQLTNFSLSSPSLFTFVNGTGVNGTVAPGEAVKLDIDLLTAPAASITGTLNFNSNIPGQNSFSIPIHVDGASPVGINELPERLYKYKMYPNPASGMVYMEGPGITKSSFRITDMAGRKMPVPANVENEKLSLDISGFSPGIYFMHLTNEHANRVMKLICR